MPNAWGREQRVLEVVDEWLSSQPDTDDLQEAIQDRFAMLSNLDANTLFPGASEASIWQLNRRFALWTRHRCPNKLRR